MKTFNFRVKQPHFKVFPEFVGVSYTKRYELFSGKFIVPDNYFLKFPISPFLNGTIIGNKYINPVTYSLIF
ncbi:MAG: hypothetical protein HQ551_10340 [Desulfobacteraceae bacterium]|nr:hypothetical protein [Desulfobacteraceae bacterium]